MKNTIKKLIFSFFALFVCVSYSYSVQKPGVPKTGVPKTPPSKTPTPPQFNKEGKKNFVPVRKVYIRETFKKDFTRPSLLQSIGPLLTSSGLIIQGNKITGLSAYTSEKGKKKWFFPVKGGLAGPAAVEGDFVFFGGADGFVYALYLSTGKALWKQSIKSIRLSAPVIQGNKLYLAGPDKLYCLNKKTGESLWTYSTQLKKSDFTLEGTARPLIAKGGLYFKTSDETLFALNKKGKLKWKRELSGGARFTSALSAPVMGKTCLYSAGLKSGLYCLNPKTGKTIWKTSYGANGDLVLYGSSLFYPSSDGKLIALDQKSGKQIWSLKTNGSTSPVPYKDILIYGEYSGPLRFVSAQEGKNLSAFFFGSGISAPPVVSGPFVYFISNTGWLYKLFLEKKEKISPSLTARL